MLSDFLPKLVLTALLLGGGLCLYNLLVRKPSREMTLFTDTESDVVHLVMNSGMAFMMTPLHSMSTVSMIVAAYALTVSGLVIRIGATLISANEKNAIGGSMYHALALLAMIYAAFHMQHEMAASMSQHIAHATSASGAVDTAMGGGAPQADWKLRAIGWLFLADAALFLLIAVVFPQAALQAAAKLEESQQSIDTAPTKVLTIQQLRIGIAPHLIMDLGMVYMLLVQVPITG
jgi:hypothetical protein